MNAIASQIASLTIVYSIVHSDADQRKHQSSASLAFVWGIHRGPVNSPHKWPVTRKMFTFDDVIMTRDTFFLASLFLAWPCLAKFCQVSSCPTCALTWRFLVNYQKRYTYSGVVLMLILTLFIIWGWKYWGQNIDIFQYLSKYSFADDIFKHISGMKF